MANHAQSTFARQSSRLNPKFDPFRHAECLRESLFDSLHEIKLPAKKPTQRRSWLFSLFSK